MTGRSDVLTVIVDAAVVAAAAEGLSQGPAKRIGEAICARLRAEYGTALVYVPAPDRSARDRAIVAGLAAGDSPAVVARRVGVHESTVRRVRHRQQRRSMAPSEWEL
jgi:hypothetical protein